MRFRAPGLKARLARSATLNILAISCSDRVGAVRIRYSVQGTRSHGAVRVPFAPQWAPGRWRHQNSGRDLSVLQRTRSAVTRERCDDI